MREVVFTKAPYMNASEQRIADMHTVLNILNILVGELSLVELCEPENADKLAELDVELNSISRDIKEGGELVPLMARIRQSESAVLGFMRELYQTKTIEKERADLQESIGNIESVYSILHKRIDELDLRAEDPDVWVRIDSVVFRKQFEEVFVAIAKNAKGSYDIRFNLARKRQRDYYIDLKIETLSEDGVLWLPLRLIDVLRDLTANARKYTPPGGKVALAVYQDDDNITAVIEDSGCGIPEEELEKVSGFGYRASNVRKRATYGGGFGLTKAVWLVTSWGGRVTIHSEVDEGTIIRIDLPNREQPADAINWTI